MNPSDEVVSFTIPYGQSGDIVPAIRSFASTHGIDAEALISAVAVEADRLALMYTDRGPLWSSKAVFLSVAAWRDTPTKSAAESDDAESETDRRPVTPENSAINDSIDRFVYFMGDDRAYMATNPHVDLLWLRKEELAQAESTTDNPHRRESSLSNFKLSRTIPAFLRRSHRIIVYQTRRAMTGGSHALRSLYSTLRDLGFDATECWDSNHNSSECTQLTGMERFIMMCTVCPSTILSYIYTIYIYLILTNPCVCLLGQEVVVSGEWCRGVLQDHGVWDIFQGRGVQYHLGFHHDDGGCR